MNAKQKDDYKDLIFDIKRVFEEVTAISNEPTEENKLIIVEKSEELLCLYKQKARFKRQRYDERLFTKTLSTLLTHRNNPDFITQMQKAYKRD